MKLAAVCWLPLALVASVGAQYFSDGWKPGQQVTEEPNLATGIPTLDRLRPAPTPTASPAAAAGGRPGSFFDISRILTAEPFASLFAKAGINITEKIALVSANLWDDRVPLITDDNFQELIVNEEMTEEEEKERVWALIISASAAKEGGVSKFVDEMYDESYNATMLAKDLPHVRWGRIDYLNVTYITTKWAVWQAPLIAIVQDRGKTLRFYKPHHLRLRDAGLREFMKQEAWKRSPPWKTSFAPGGSNEYILDFYATWMTKLYNVTVWIPKWLLYILSGSAASVVINFMHKSDNKPAPKPAVKEKEKGKKETPTAVPKSEVVAAPAASSSGVTQGAAKKRKNKK